jgi:GTP-binding protein HflX
MLDKAIVIHPQLKGRPGETGSLRTQNSKLEEACGLTRAADLEVVLAQVVPIQKITPATYIGKGKVDEIGIYIKQNAIMLAVMNTEITPIQQRNLEKAWECKVIDRTALILEIFGQRANSKEGHLQVALAAQEYQKSRLVRSWTHLERQRGGAGFMGGPGETQIESDRRAIRDRIALIKKQLDTVVRTREEHRKSRQKVPYKIVALVGYTNAGKSTLFNKLTGANVLAEDKLFATLDPTMRIIKLPSGTKVIMSDTVGFISDLPTQLVAAFRATLEEVVEADLIVHVRDIISPETEEQKEDVLRVMASLGLEHKIANNTVEVLNKADLLFKNLESVKSEPKEADYLIPDSDILDAKKLYISAITGKGVEEMLAVIDKEIARDNNQVSIKLDVADGKMLAWLHEHGNIISQTRKGEKLYLQVSISEKNLGMFRKMQA